MGRVGGDPVLARIRDAANCRWLRIEVSVQLIYREAFFGIEGIANGGRRNRCVESRGVFQSTERLKFIHAREEFHRNRLKFVHPREGFHGKEILK
jgi:hypothetical protein